MPSLLFAASKQSSSPYINRFLQPDSIVPDLSKPQSWNRYGYVVNNPLHHTDPSGHRPTECEFSEGCGSVTQAQKNKDTQTLARLKAKSRDRKCAEGNEAYCPGDPAEIIAFTGTMIVGAAATETFILGGGAATAADAALLKLTLSCARSIICYRVAVALGILNYYPSSNGFASDPKLITLQQGQIITRYGPITGQYASPIGTSLSSRALPLGTNTSLIRGFEVIQPIDNVLSGPTQGWFGQPGGGIQYYLGIGSRTIQSLIDSGHLLELP